MLDFIPPSAQLYFCTAFDLKTHADDGMTTVRKLIREYLTDIAEDPYGLAHYWFYAGTRERKPLGTGHIRVASYVGHYDPNNPKMWACEYIYRDSSSHLRFWSIEIGLVREDESLRFTMVHKHWIREGVVLGGLPDTPEYRTPYLIFNLIDSSDFQVTRGGRKLRNHASSVDTEAQGAHIAKIALDPDRSVPLVLLCTWREDFDSAPAPLIDAAQTSKELAGNALVFTLKDPEAIRSFNETVGDPNLRVNAGMVRCFQPHPKPDKPRHHRFFLRDVIRGQGETSIRAILVEYLVRNGRHIQATDVYRLRQVSMLRSKAFIQNRVLTSLETDTGVSPPTVLPAVQAASPVRPKENAPQEPRDTPDIDEVLDYAAMLEDKIEMMYEEIQRSSLRPVKGDAPAAPVGLVMFPRSLDDILSNAELIYGDTLAITPRAFRSAKSAHLESKYFPDAWAIIDAMHRVLHPMLFSGDGGDIEFAFRSQTGFSLSMKEGSGTSKNSRLSALRKSVFEGREIDVSAHIKYGARNPKLLRVHFAVDHQSGKIVIDHFGDHLDNASTHKVG